MKEKSKISVKAVMLTILLVVLLCGAAVGVWGLTRVWLEKVPIKNPYGYMNPDETKADPDEGITIDGILDEEEYQNNNWLYLHNGNGGSTVDIAMTSYYGEKGMYFVYDVTESTPIYVNLNRNNTLNSCVEMYLALSDVTNMNSSKLFEIDLMPTGDMVFKQRSARGSWYDVATTDDKMAYLGATTKGGKVNTEDCYGYYLEFFIPWEYMEWLGMDTASMKTDYVYVNPAHITSYNYEGTSTSNDRYWYSFASQHGASGLGMVSMYYKFDKNGAIGTVPVTFVEGEHYSITGVRSVIPGMKAYITITPEEGYALSSILVNGEEYIKKVSYNEDGSVNLYLKGTENGLTIAASAEKVTEGNKTLSGTVSLHKLGGDSFDGLSIGYKGPKGEKPITLDKNGRFVLENLAQGYYIITVEKDGYEPITRGICLNRDIDTELTLEYNLFTEASGWDIDKQNDGILTLIGGGNGTVKSYRQYTDVDLTVKVKAKPATADAGSGKTSVNFAFANGKTYSIRIGCNNSNTIVIQNRNNTIVSGWGVHYKLNDAERAKYESGGINLRVLRNGTEVTIYLEDGKDRTKMNAVYSIDLSEHITVDTQATVAISHFEDEGERIDFPFTLTDKLNKVTLKLSDKNGRKVTTERKGYVVGDTVVVSADKGYYLVGMTVNGKAIDVDADGIGRFIAKGKNYTVETVTAKGVFRGTSGWNILKQHEGMLTLIGGGNGVIKSYDKHTDVDLTVKVKAEHAEADAGSGKTAITFLFDGNKKYSIRIGCNNSNKVVIQNRASNKDKSYVITGGKIHHTLSDAERAKYESDGINLRVLRNGTQVTVYLEDGMDSTKMNAVYSIDLSDKGIAADTLAEVRIEHFEDAGADIDFPFTFTDKLNKVTLKISDKNGKKITTERKSYVVGDTVVVSADEGYYLVGMTVNGKAINVDADGIGRFIAEGTNYTIETVTAAKGVFRGTSGWNILKQHEGLLTLIGGGNGVIKSYDKYTDVDLTVKVKAEHAEADAGSGKTAITFLFDGNKKYSIRIGCNNSNKVVIQNRASSSDKSYVITGGKIHHTLSDAERAKYESDGINLRVLRNGTQVTVYLEDGMDSTKMNAVYSIDLSDKGIAADTLAEVRIEHFEDAGADIDFPFTFTDKLDKVTLKLSDKNGKKLTTERNSYVVGDTVVVSAEKGYYLAEMTVNGKAIDVDADGIGRFIAEETNYTIETVTDEVKCKAKIGENSYFTLEEAVAAANSDTTSESVTITVLDDIELKAGLSIKRNIVFTTSDDNPVIISASSVVTGVLISINEGIEFTIDGAITINGNNIARTMLIQNNGGTFTLGADAAVVNAKRTGNGALGAAFYNDSGTAHLYGDFIGNSTSSGGAAVRINKGTVTIYEGTYSNNTATQTDGSGGGAIYNKSGTVVIHDGEFNENSALYGGAIRNESGGTVKISGGTYSNNTATSLGGVIYNVGALEITGGTFKSNTADQGGAIFTRNKNDVSITNAAFNQNSATDGGAIYCRDQEMTITDCTFEANEATNGNVLYSNGGTISVIDSTIPESDIYKSEDSTITFIDKVKYEAKIGESSYATLEEAVVAANSDTTSESVTITVLDNVELTAGLTINRNIVFTTSENNPVIISGTSAVSGVLISINEGKEFTINGDITINGNNIARTMLIQNNGGTFTLGADAAVVNAKRTGDGALGAAFFNNGGTAHLYGNFIGNNTSAGGAAVRIANGTVNIYGGIYSNNTLTHTTQNGGGAIYNKSGTVIIHDGEFNENSALYGGVIRNESGGTVKISGGTYSNNTATSLGGVIYNVGALEITGGTFKSNTADQGGAIFTRNKNDVSITNAAFNQNSATDGGAIYCREQTMTITDCTFEGNTATNGNVLCSYAGTINVIGFTISEGDIKEYGSSTITFTANQAGNGKTTLMEESKLLSAIYSVFLAIKRSIL